MRLLPVLLVLAMLGVGAVTAAPAGAVVGVIQEFAIPTPESRPDSITTGPDGALWFTEGRLDGVTGDKVGRISPSGVITEYVLHVPNGLPYQDSDPMGRPADGNLWITLRRANRILRMYTAGVVTYDVEVPPELPTDPATTPKLARPDNITTGPDGPGDSIAPAPLLVRSP